MNTEPSTPQETQAAPAARFLMKAVDTRQGDTIRLPLPSDGEPARQWKEVQVRKVISERSAVHILTDRWPIPYVCPAEQLVEALDITRTAYLRCPYCSSGNGNRLVITVTLKDFDLSLFSRAQAGPVAVVIEPNDHVIVAYCAKHFQDFLDAR